MRTHLRAISDDDVRYLAHHYTRYLGDLSGGQAIAALVARHYGATPDQLGFYRFEIADDGIVRYKRGYREAMNALALSPDEVDVLIDEVRTSFRMNSADLRGPRRLSRADAAGGASRRIEPASRRASSPGMISLHDPSRPRHPLGRLQRHHAAC